MNGNLPCISTSAQVPVVLGLPSDARQKLRDNVKRRLPHVKTEEYEDELHAYTLDDDGQNVESIDSRSSTSSSLSDPSNTNHLQSDMEKCRTPQTITFHQVVDVDDPEVVQHPTVVDLD